MLMKFHQAVMIKPDVGGNHTYGLGIHDVHEDHVTNHMIVKLIDAGLVTDPAEGELEQGESFDGRQKRLAKKFSAQAEMKKAAELLEDDTLSDVDESGKKKRKR